jgi:hypothetical protein
MSQNITFEQLEAELELLKVLKQMAADGTTFDEARVRVIMARNCTWGYASDLLTSYENIGNFKFTR